jgi:hypothetical protein
MAGSVAGDPETRHYTGNSLNYPMTTADASNEGDLLVSIPRPCWLTISRVCIFGFSLVVCVAAGFLVLTDLVHHAGITGTQRALLAVFAGLLLFNALFKVVLLWFSLKLPLEIFKSGIAFQGVKMPWEAVEGCHWARYSPNTLVVRHHRLRHDLLIPREHWADVEAALRDVGRWQS